MKERTRARGRINAFHSTWDSYSKTHVDGATVTESICVLVTQYGIVCRINFSEYFAQLGVCLKQTIKFYTFSQPVHSHRFENLACIQISV